MSMTHWLVVGIIVLVLFGGGGKISGLMGDVAKGIKSFKKGMAEDDDVAAAPPQAPRAIDHMPVTPGPAGVQPAGPAVEVKTRDQAETRV